MRLPARTAVSLAAAFGAALALVVGAVPATPQSATPPAGQPAPPPPMTNLQFFPKDTPRPVVIQNMRQFSFALGVRCDHCHVDEGQGGKQDFASDEKTPKVKARAMLQMTKQINEDLLAKIPERTHPPVNVSCYTCHHGLVKPETLGDRLQAAATAGGGDSAVAELKLLRESADFGRFDVSEWGVTEAARNLAGAGKRKEAIAIQNANAALHPESSAILSSLAEIHLADGDTAAAVEILKKIVAKEPENRRAKGMLEKLSGSGKP